MSCNTFQDCLISLTWEMVEEQGKKTGFKKTKNKHIQPTTILEFDNYPCKNIERLRKCVAYAGKRSSLRCSENGKTYTLDKKDWDFESICYHVDGGIIEKNDAQTRCDYALFLKDSSEKGTGTTILVELKGGDTKKALSQIKETLAMELFRNVPKIYKRVYGRIVAASSVPRIQNTNEFVDLKTILMKLGGNLKIKEIDFELPYISLG